MRDTHVITRCTLVAFLLAAGGATGAEQGWPSDGLLLRAGSVPTAAATNLLTDADARLAAAGRYVLQLDGPITPQRRSNLLAVGVELGRYLPVHAYLVSPTDAVDLTPVAELGFVRWVGEYRSQWKLDPTIGLRTFSTPDRLTLQALNKVNLLIHLFDGIDRAPTLQALEAGGAEVRVVRRSGPNDVIDAVMDLSAVAALADSSDVRFVEEAPELTPRNDTNEWIIQSNILDATPVWDHGLHGEGQIGGLIDWPVDVDHCSFFDDAPIGPDHRKVVAYRGAMGSDSHGTHTAGTFAGDWDVWGAPDFRDGIALAAKLSYSSAPDIAGDPSSLVLRFTDAHEDGARVHSNSWGDDGTTEYTTWSEQIDRFSRDYEDSLVCFAATNLSTLKTPENAKNVLAVAATEDTPDQDNHCTGGAGPTSDGRRKPEIYAPGCGTWSSKASTDCSWLSFTGTSMASPAISGAGLLIRQYYDEGFYPTGAATADDELIPSGALVKATLLNGAVDMLGITGYPSDTEGWGRLVLDGALHFEGDVRTLYVEDVRNADGLSTSDSLSYIVEVISDGEPLRVTLVWTDVPATVGASFTPINNLDLAVTDPNGTTYLGNSFFDGESTAIGNADPLNNVEQVHRLIPVTGEYTIDVTATEVNVETQGFALVVTGAITIGTDQPPCQGDLNGDGTVDPLDAGFVLSRFGCAVGAGDPNCDSADANGDGLVDPLDLGFVLSRFGSCS